MLYLISLGLYDKEDMSVKALEAARKCAKLYLESYTDFFSYRPEDLSKFIGKDVIPVSREDVENKVEKILSEASKRDIGLLVGGDCLSATTHSSIILDAKKKGVPVKIIHGSSVLTAIGEIGLFLYNFGKTTSIPFENENIETPYDVIKQNLDLHTLCLLDLRPDEKRFMRAAEAIRYFLGVESKRREGVLSEDRLCVLCAGLGSDRQVIRAGKASELAKDATQVYPQCLIIPGKLHFMEADFLEHYGKVG